MELKFDLSKVLTRAGQVEVGKEYYFFDEIRPCIEDIHLKRAKLTYINDDIDYPFGIGESAHSYAYPIPKKKTRPMTLEEIKEYWVNHRTEIISYKDSKQEILSMITGFTSYTDSEGVIQRGVYIGSALYIGEHSFIKGATREDGSKFEVEL